MPDWNALVQERLGTRHPISVEEAEVISELCGHLEDLYEELRAKGLGESDAIGQAMGALASWHKLAKRLRREGRAANSDPSNEVSLATLPRQSDRIHGLARDLAAP